MNFIEHLQYCSPKTSTKKIFVLLIALSIGMFAFATPAAHAMECNGSYPGSVTSEGDDLVVQIQDVDTSLLSPYADAKPYTGGNRVSIYFDTDPASRGAEYCLFVYRDEWLLRRTSQPGFFSIQVDAGSIANIEADSTKGFVVKFKRSHIRESINRCWNRHM